MPSQSTPQMAHRPPIFLHWLVQEPRGRGRLDWGGAKARMEGAKARMEGAKARMEGAKARMEGAKARMEGAKARMEGANGSTGNGRVRLARASGGPKATDPRDSLPCAYRRSSTVSSSRSAAP